MPSDLRYFTVLGADDRRVKPADDFLFSLVAQGRSPNTAESYAGGLALFLTWCAISGTTVAGAPSRLGIFVLWLRYYDPLSAGRRGEEVVRGPARINAILAAVREFYKSLVMSRGVPASCLDALYRVVQDRDVPVAATGEFSRGLRIGARHRVPVSHQGVDRATEEEATALLRACANARDRLVVGLALRAGLRRGEIAGLRLEDVHLSMGQLAGCRTAGPHLHVRKRHNPNRAAAKSLSARELPCDPLLVRLFDDWAAERSDIRAATDCDFVIVALRGPTAGHSVRPELINELFVDLCDRARLTRRVHPHMLRHSMLSNVLDHGGTLDEAQALAGHHSPETTAICQHPDPDRLRAAIERVPSRHPARGRQ